MNTVARTRVTGAERGEFAARHAARYAAGEFICAMAASTQRSDGFVLRVLIDDDVAIRQPIATATEPTDTASAHQKDTKKSAQAKSGQAKLQKKTPQ